jgi:hypothetical protein
MKITRRPMCRIYDDNLPFSPSGAVPLDTLLQLPSGWDVSLPGYVLSNMISATDEFIVIDPFVGAGATLLACSRKGQACIGSDIDPLAVVASYAKTGIRSPGEVFEAVANARNLLASDLTLTPETLRLGQSLWANCAVTAIACNWMLRAWSPDSSERHDSIQDLWSNAGTVDNSTKVFWADARSDGLWQVIANHAQDRPWLIITSPPFADSRGTFGKCAVWLRGLGADLAAQVTTRSVGCHTKDQLMTGNRACVDEFWHSILLAKVATHCRNRAIVVAEYEVLDDDWSWMNSLGHHGAINGWRSIALHPLYDVPPDGRDHVTEGGLLVAER